LAAQQQKAQQSRVSDNDINDFMNTYCGGAQEPSYPMVPAAGAPPLPPLPPPAPPAEPALSSALAKLRAKKAAKQLSLPPPPPPPPQQPPLMMALEKLRKINEPVNPIYNPMMVPHQGPTI